MRLASVEERARGYLHSNCSMCHRPTSGTGAHLDLRFGSDLTVTGCEKSSFPGVDGVTVLSPGTPERSSLFLRASSRGDSQMPPLATNKVDDAAVGVLQTWIRSLARCP